MKIVTIVGARPQFIKAAAVSRSIRSGLGIQEVLVHTGQHYDHNISGIFFEEMEIPKPDYHFGVGSGPHGQQTGKMLEAIESVLLSQRPHMVLVYGDTNSTLAGSLAASKLNIPVAHVEAGLRSFNRKMPEEINRVLTDHLSSLLFAPTDNALSNLNREGIASDVIVRTGDVMYDAALYYAAKAKSQSNILNALGLKPDGFILATVHRAENTDDIDNLRSILGALSKIGAEVPIVFPIHPRTRSVIARHPHLTHSLGLVRVVDPLGYFDMITLEQHARLIVTDSGGVQKEASFHNVRCVTLREETEWMELIELDRNTLAPPALGAEAIAETIRVALSREKIGTVDVYGDGRAAESIVEALLRYA